VGASGALDATRQAIDRQRERGVTALADAVGGIGAKGVDLLAELASAVLDGGGPDR
jgi:hypothetical protein